MTKPIKLLIVDDMASIRCMLRSLLQAHPRIKIVGEAEDPYEAREKIKKLNPDVITLDVEMPKMDGLSFLEKIMALRPMPVVMLSTLTGRGTDIAVRALEIGAVDCLAKPTATSEGELKNFTAMLTDKIITASEARIRASNNAAPAKKVFSQRALLANAPEFIAFGASTGGVETFSNIVHHLPPNLPPIFLTQHMPAGGFTDSFARRLSDSSAYKVVEAQNGMPVRAGMIALAPGGRHLQIKRNGAGYYCSLSDGPAVSGHRPSVDVLFQSAAELRAEHAVAILLTGMGKDGAEGLLKLRQSGIHTISQSQASCVVYGMPKAAEKLGASAEVLDLDGIVGAVVKRCFG